MTTHQHEEIIDNKTEKQLDISQESIRICLLVFHHKTVDLELDQGLKDFRKQIHFFFTHISPAHDLSIVFRIFTFEVKENGLIRLLTKF